MNILFQVPNSKLETTIYYYSKVKENTFIIVFDISEAY